MKKDDEEMKRWRKDDKEEGKVGIGDPCDCMMIEIMKNE